jgi:hypothetical protein
MPDRRYPMPGPTDFTAAQEKAMRDTQDGLREQAKGALKDLQDQHQSDDDEKYETADFVRPHLRGDQ